MSGDDRIERALSAARPPTEADDGWADTADGHAALAAIRTAAEQAHRSRAVRIRVPRPVGVRRPVYLGIAGLAVAAVVAGVVFVVTGAGAHRRSTPVATGPSSAQQAPPRLGGRLLLTGYSTCAATVDGLRSHAAAHASLLGQVSAYAFGPDASAPDAAIDGAAAKAAVGSNVYPGSNGYSGTNDQVHGVDEPDIVKTDGRRIVTVTGGVLRVTDAADHRVVGSLDLGAYNGAGNAELLMSGNRVLVLLGGTDDGPQLSYGPMALPAAGLTSAATTVLLVDISHPVPRLVSMFRPNGELVDARLVGGVARLVVRNTPNLQLQVPHARTAKARLSAYRREIERARLSAWLPSWTVTTGSAAPVTRSVSCASVSHPASYTGLSMLTVYTVQPSAGFAHVEPVSLAADGGTVYATTGSLYLASDAGIGTAGDTTQIHRFDIRGSAAPVYLGSGTVPGSVSSSYSMSQWDGSLRVVTTREPGQRHGLYVLDAATLALRGEVRNFGAGENLHAVRFLGALGYVVTYQQLDPLFVLDLHDPRHPTITGRLTLTGYSGYLHPVAAGRLLGVGEATVPNPDEGGLAKPVGVQVSLFDVTDPAKPISLDRVIRKNSAGDDGDIDPHAFLYWAPARLAVVPMPGGDQGADSALLVRVGRSTLTTVGTITNPGPAGERGISRSLVIGDDLWTVAPSGLVATDLRTLTRQASVPFS